MDAVTIQPGSVVITPTELYQEMRHIGDEVKRIGTLIDPALAEVRADIGDNRSRIEALTMETRAEVKALDTRMHGINARLWFAAGTAAGAGGLGGWLASALTGGG